MEASRAHCPNVDPRVRRRDGGDPPGARARPQRQGGVEAAPEVDAAGPARDPARRAAQLGAERDRKSTRLNSSHGYISYAVFCLKKKKTIKNSGQEHLSHIDPTRPRQQTTSVRRPKNGYALHERRNNPRPSGQATDATRQRAHNP